VGGGEIKGRGIPSLFFLLREEKRKKKWELPKKEGKGSFLLF